VFAVPEIEAPIGTIEDVMTIVSSGEIEVRLSLPVHPDLTDLLGTVATHASIPVYEIRLRAFGRKRVFLYSA